MNTSQSGQTYSVRPMAVGGTFYPDSTESIKKIMTSYYKPYKAISIYKEVAAVIVPHAGYAFSGAIAASAFAQINPSAKYDRIFLIGASHHVYINGAAIDTAFDYYDTPLGEVKVDTTLCSKLIAENNCFSSRTDAHIKEHSLEVQLPLLKFHLKEMPPIVPIIIGTDSLPTLKEIAHALSPYFDGRNLFVISSDFSHYPTYEEANDIDKRTENAIMKGNLNDFIQVLDKNNKLYPGLATSACGHSAIEVLLLILAQESGYRINHVMYQNSGNSAYGSRDRVVGYHSFIITKGSDNDGLKYTLTDEEKSTLLKIARTAITNKINHKKEVLYQPDELTDNLKVGCGAFVTLYERSKLRGCIGRFGDRTPLYKLIEEMAISAAFKDPRFFPLEHEELNEINIEISVLTPLKRIHNIKDFVLGKEGIYMEKNGRSGTFLPQVAQETGWTKEEFLGHCAQDKAGLGWDGWKDAHLYTYEAILFNENRE